MHFTPTYKAFHTFSNVKNFITAHHGELVDFIKQVAPYILAIALLAQVLTITFFSELFEGVVDPRIFLSPIYWSIFLLQIVQGYFFAVIAINWHRLVLLGENKYEKMKVLQPRRHEIVFVIMGIVIPVLSWLAGTIVMLIGFSIGVGLKFVTLPIISGLVMAFTMIAALVYIIFLAIRLSFYFPAKALNADITLRSAYRLSKGYVWKTIISFIILLVPVIILSFIYQLIAELIASFFPETIHYYALFGLYIPLLLYAQPIMTAIGVTILSNYYQHALQNKPFPTAPEPAAEQTNTLENDPMNQMEANHQDMNKARKALDKGK